MKYYNIALIGVADYYKRRHKLRDPLIPPLWMNKKEEKAWRIGVNWASRQERR